MRELESFAKTFGLTQKQLDKIKIWEKKLDQRLIEQQKKEHSGDWLYEECWELGHPYTGAIGGGITYSFFPTSVGVVIKVSYSGFPEDDIDVSDYEHW